MAARPGRCWPPSRGPARRGRRDVDLVGALVGWRPGRSGPRRRVGAAARVAGAALVVDPTHHAGILPIDVKQLDPDFLVFPTYKWVLGPYGRAFLYVAKRWQDGVPLEQTGAARRAMDSIASPYMHGISYVTSARRFDMGERDFFIGLEMAAIGMELVAEWGTTAITERLSMLTNRLAEGLPNAGVTISPTHLRAPHVLSLSFPDGMPADLPERLAAENVFVSPRLGRLRIAPHVYNDEADVDRFLTTFRKLTA